MNNDVHREIVELTQELVRIPSRSEKETEKKIADFIFNRLSSFGLNPKRIGTDTQPSVTCYIEKDSDSKTIWLEAPLDTARNSDVGSWKFPPFDGVIDDGKLYGCGASSCKVAIAMYMILARELNKDRNFKGNIFLAFNADEQCGSLVGIREILPSAPRADICILGYQDYDEISIGARGWLRLELQTLGVMGHTGSRVETGLNAIHLMARAINAISAIKLKFKKNPFFWFGPSLHVTTAKGGTAINIIPDFCRACIDVRLVPGQTDVDVLKSIERELVKIKKRDKNFDYKLDVIQYQPAYITDPKHEFIQILQKKIQEKRGKRLPLVASGRGSAGNLISELGIPIINAFGCKIGNDFAPNEWVDIESIDLIYKILKNSLTEFTN